MKRSNTVLLAVALSGLLCAACGESAERSASASADATAKAAETAPPATPAVIPTDRWVGQWDGPEGTSLVIGGRDGAYELVITNLDGARRFPARAEGERIVFTRDGKDESLRATNGLDTGMKWLSEKTQCLTIRTGEGYCRD